jgi:hypothetical protein
MHRAGHEPVFDVFIYKGRANWIIRIPQTLVSGLEHSHQAELIDHLVIDKTI